MIPTEPVILLSWCNTKLRDEYDSLGALCEEFGVSEVEICAKISTIGYVYEEKTNRFVPTT